MRRLKLFFACLLMAVLSIGQVWATDEVVYTLTPVAGSDNGYATNEDIDITDGETTITWNVTGNATLTPWRIGGKNLSGVNREVYSKDAMSAAITKVELTVGTASSVTVNSLKLIVASDEDFSDVIDEVTEDFTASSTITFEPTSPATKWATGAYYKFVFNVTIGGNNKYVQFTEAKFYAEAAAPAHTITAQSNDESKGTVSLTGSVITGSPKANCRYASPAYTVTSGNATVAQSGNAFTVTPSSDCTVRINFEAIPQYTVTWNNNGSTSTSQVLEGNKPVFPATPAACDATSTSFIGWATAPWDGKLANLSGKTVYTSADAMPAVNAAVTYYAVFAKSSGTASNLFEWAGGSSADLTAEGNHVTAQGLGSDYAAGNSPYLVKFDGTGDYIIIDTEAAIGSVDIRVKMIGGANTSSITVQEADSKDAELFTDVETLSISGAQNDVVNLATKNAFASTSRAVKLLFTKGSNVGLGPITIVGAVSMSDYMTTCAAPTCEDLGTPSVTVTNKTYNSAKLTWEAVANAAKYVVKFNGEDHEVTNNYYDATGLTPSTQYTYQVKAIAAANQDDYCDGEFTTEANFTTENAPEVQLWLVEKQGETAKNGGTHALGVEFDIPASTLECSKVFRGWTTETYKDYTHATDAPAVLMNKYTFESETAVTLYAVYADVAAGPTTNIAYLNTETTTNMTGGNDAALLGLNAEEWSVVGAKGGNSNYPGLNKAKDIRLYYQSDNVGNTITITAPQTIASVALTFTTDDYSNAWVKVGDEAVTLSDGVYPINATSFVIGNANTSNVQVRISNIAVNFPGAQSNWATTCVDPLENPTFSLDPVVAPVNDKYEEAINVVITNNAGEGTIYYTTNGQNPTSASTEYTEPIELNTCGTKTIKAIVISATNQSEVVSATYEMAIPIPPVSAEDPYSEAEAIQVYNSGCYDNEDVWVTGTVKTAQFYSSNTYTITLTNDFQFYYFYESFDGENLVPFTEDYIVAGDVLVAKGKLSKHNTTYQIANGYLVSRTPASKEPIDSDIDNPLSVAAAINYIDNAATYDLSEDEYVAGIVESIAECPQHEGTYDIIVLDATDNTKQMKFFGCDVKTFAGIKQYDQITGKGKLFKYYSTYELNYPCEVAALTPYVAPVVDVTGVEVDETATVMVGKTVQLTATVAPEGATNKNVAWSVKEGDEAYAEVSATGLVTGLAEGEATIIVTTEDGGFTDECVVTVNPIPYWATVYDNNVVVAHTGSGTDDGTITISETAYKLVKAGAASNTGTIKVTVPAGATDLHFHAFAWGGKTAKIQIAGVENASISEFDLAGEAGAAGSGNDFTLAGDPVDQYYHVSFDAVADETEIVFSKATGSADNRFFFYGVNQEGGNFGSYQRTVTENNYGTICLPYAGTISGATLLDIAYFDGAMIYCDEVNGVALKAGKPYIFYATSNSLNVAYTANIETAAGEANGLHGFYNLSNMATDAADKKDLDEDQGNYILYNNQYWLVSGRAAYINNFRAYIKLDEISTTAPDPVPGAAPRRRVAMTVNGEQVATGVDALNASEAPVKVIIDGQLFILRGEKMYDVNGQVVK